MRKTEVHLERLLGRHVIDVDGERVGPIEEVIAEEQGDEWVVKEYLVGRAALFERLSARLVGQKVLRFFGAKTHGGFRVPWKQMDLSNPRKPRLLCPRRELKNFHH